MQFSLEIYKNLLVEKLKKKLCIFYDAVIVIIKIFKLRNIFYFIEKRKKIREKM